MSERIEREIAETMERIRAAKILRDRERAAVNDNLARAQADARWARVAIATFILIVTCAILLLWRFS